VVASLPMLFRRVNVCDEDTSTLADCYKTWSTTDRQSKLRVDVDTLSSSKVVTATNMLLQ
jgi:hypothetical protein